MIQITIKTNLKINGNKFTASTMLILSMTILFTQIKINYTIATTFNSSI